MKKDTVSHIVSKKKDGKSDIKDNTYVDFYH